VVYWCNWLLALHHGLPFLGEYSGTTMNLITNNSFDPIEQEQYSDELKALIYRLLNKDPGKRPAIQEVISVPIIRDAVVALVKEFEGKVFFDLRNSLIDHDASFEKYFLSSEDRVPYVVSHFNEFPSTFSQIDLPDSIY
jgi:serine/threonine protein kinase